MWGCFAGFTRKTPPHTWSTTQSPKEPKNTKEFFMLKKVLLILVGVALTVGVMGVAGFAYAQTQNPPDAEDTHLPFGFMKGRGGRGGFGGFNGGDGVLHDYLLPAIAEVFGFTDEQVQAFQTSREAMESVRENQTIEEMQANMHTAFTAAVEAALADGTITQEEADQMLARQAALASRDFSRFSGRGMNGGSGGFPGADGPLHEHIQTALAEALGISVEELDDLNLRDYAQEQGLSADEVVELMNEVFASALNAAVENGDLTQEQADWMKERMGDFGSRMPFGRGGRGNSGGPNIGQ